MQQAGCTWPESILQTRNIKRPLSNIRSSLKQAPAYVPALNNLATAYQQEKNPLALEYAEKAYQLAPVAQR